MIHEYIDSTLFESVFTITSAYLKIQLRLTLLSCWTHYSCGRCVSHCVKATEVDEPITSATLIRNLTMYFTWLESTRNYFQDHPWTNMRQRTNKWFVNEKVNINCSTLILFDRPLPADQYSRAQTYGLQFTIITDYFDSFEQSIICTCNLLVSDWNRNSAIVNHWPKLICCFWFTGQLDETLWALSTYKYKNSSVSSGRKTHRIVVTNNCEM